MEAEYSINKNSSTAAAKYQTADVLAKALSNLRFCKLRDKLRMFDLFVVQHQHPS